MFFTVFTVLVTGVDGGMSHSPAVSEAVHVILGREERGVDVGNNSRNQPSSTDNNK